VAQNTPMDANFTIYCIVQNATNAD